MHVELRKLNEGILFEGINEDGLTVKIEGGPSEGGTGVGLRPMQMALMALAGCTSIDVMLILNKMRQEVSDYQVIVDGKRAEDQTPKKFTDIHMHFILEGQIDQDKAERAVELSIEKYCSVAHSLNPEINITFDVKIA